jgi:predicted small integral membrane protein
MGALNVATAVLSQRLIVLVSVAGGIALAWIALIEPNEWRLGVLAIYAVGVVLPAVWLAGRR